MLVNFGKFTHIIPFGAPFSNIYVYFIQCAWVTFNVLSILFHLNGWTSKFVLQTIFKSLLHSPTLNHMFNSFFVIRRYRYCIFRPTFTPLIVIILFSFHFKVLVMSVTQNIYRQEDVNLPDFNVLF